jgi:multicomponent Na+:H+ antiporter subunit G
MNGALDVVTAVLLVIGGLFCVVGGIGLHRFSDFYQRTHAASVTDTAGAGLILLGLMFQGGVSMVTLKLVLVLAFLLFTSPAIAHALVKAAHGHGLALELEVPDDDASPATSGESGGGE